jgi:hypothetical protein
MMTSSGSCLEKKMIEICTTWRNGLIELVAIPLESEESEKRRLKKMLGSFLIY